MWSNVVLFLYFIITKNAFYIFHSFSCTIFLFHSVCKVILQRNSVFGLKKELREKMEPLFFYSFNFIVYVMELHTLYNTKRAIERNVSFPYFFCIWQIDYIFFALNVKGTNLNMTKGGIWKICIVV